MDTKTLVRNLRKFFRELNEKTKKYSYVWMDYGPYRFNLQIIVYRTDKSEFEEIEYLERLMKKKIPGEYKMIEWIKAKFDENKFIQDKEIDGILLFSEIETVL